MTRLAHLTLAALLLAVPACNKAEAEAHAEAEVSGESALALDPEFAQNALVEEHEQGTVAFRVDTDGRVQAAVSATTGAAIHEGLTGSLVWHAEGGEPKTIPLVADPQTHYLIAAGPKLEADLTEVNYTLSVSGKPWSGTLHVPAGGTAALIASANATAEIELPDTGPHGGTIQVVGDDRLELVADVDTGETRVYVLDARLQPVSLEGRTIRLGFVGARAQTVLLAPSPTGLYFAGSFGAALNPFRATVALGFGGRTHVALWGYRPGVRLVASPIRAPRLGIYVTGGFSGPTFTAYAKSRGELDVEARVHDNRDGLKESYPDHAKGHRDRDNVKVKVDDRGHGASKAKAQVKGSGAKVNVHTSGGSSKGGSSKGGSSKGGSSKGGSSKGGKR